MKGLMVIAVACVLLGGCATWDGLTPNTKTGAGIGAVSGGVLGALIDSNRPWRGAIIGAAAGAAAGGWIGSTTDKEVSTPVVDSNAAVINQAALEAAKQNATVSYSRTTESGIKEEVVATPISRSGNIRTVNIKYYQNGRLVSSETREVSIT